jgi:hypothetical protein
MAAKKVNWYGIITRVVKMTNAKASTGKSQGSTGYMNIVAMIIESYALESTWLLITVIIQNRVDSAFFNESTVYIEVSPT